MPSSETTANNRQNFLFFCNICSKPFYKEISRNRHIPYCKRTHGGARVRQKPCLHCGRTKKKCTFQVPCARCAQKGLHCTYQTESRAHASDRMGSASSDIESTETNKSWSLKATSEIVRSDRNELEIRDSVPSKPRHPTKYNADHDPDIGLYSAWTTKDDHYPCVSCVNEIPMKETQGLLKKFTFSDPVARNNATSLIRLLASMPHMMLRKETFPPFIHSYEGSQSSLLEPLVTCMDIAQLFVSRRKSNNSFLWRTCQAEQLRLISNLESFDKYELFAALQAILIYTIMMFLDRDALQYVNVHQVLLSFYVGTELMRKVHKEPFCQNEWSSPSSTWEDWIFAESRRRFACLWYVMTLVINLDAGLPCETTDGFRTLPLPCPRSLWEANSRPKWQSEWDEYSTSLRRGVRLIGELNELQNRDDDESDPKLVVWNSGTDMLGTMLNFTAILVKTRPVEECNFRYGHNKEEDQKYLTE